MQLLAFLIISVFTTDEKEPDILENSGQNSILVRVEKVEYIKKKSNYFGVYYNEKLAKWRAQRYNKNEKKIANNGTYKDEETAAHASDTLARKLIANGEKGHKLNFPDDHADVYQEIRNYIGVYFQKRDLTWRAQRYSSNEKKIANNGTYKDEETAAHASDTLARKLIANGEKGHKLNFVDDHADVYPKEMTKTSDYIGVSYNKRDSTWVARRHSKNKNKTVHNGSSYKDEETAAHASDTLARKLISNGEKRHKLNFPDDDTEVCSKNQQNKRKRPADFKDYQKYEQFLDEFE